MVPITIENSEEPIIIFGPSIGRTWYLFVHQCDISEGVAVEETFKVIENALGKVYGLVNSAAINPSRNDALHREAKDWKDTLEVNLTGAFNCS
jgi:NAD(P)-dependent dehydrogenase (short-subunit alcohol dehydrogenase family)